LKIGWRLDEIIVSRGWCVFGTQCIDRSRRRTVDRYASAGKSFCVLDLWTHELENLAWLWKVSVEIPAAAVQELSSLRDFCCYFWLTLTFGLTDRRTHAQTHGCTRGQPDCLMPPVLDRWQRHTRKWRTI